MVGHTLLYKMSGKGAGQKTGGKGSWRRKGKKTTSAAQESDKLWLASLRQGCRAIGDIDSATMIISGKEQALSFQKPELALDMRANTYVLKGKPEEKALVDVITDILPQLDKLKKAADEEKKDEEKKEDLGDVDNVDFSKTEENKE